MRKTFRERAIEELEARGCRILSRGSKSVKLSDPTGEGYYYYVGVQSVRWGKSKAESISLTDAFRGV